MINLDELLQRESEQVEWKEDVADVNDVVRTLVAFANDLSNLGGGRVVCGAAEHKDPHGFPTVALVGLSAARCRELRGTVVSRCAQNVSPSLAPLIDELPTADPARRVLVFTIVATGHAHALREGASSTHWVRIDSQTREARNGILLRLLSARGAILPWDRRLADGATIEDLDLLALRETLIQMRSWDPARSIDHWLDPDVALSPFLPPLCGREPLSGTVRPRNFAILLFGRNPQRFVAGAVASFSLYPGTSRAEPTSERLLLDGTLLHQARMLIQRLNVEAIGLTDKSTPGPDNVQKYPARALQEAIVNALVHRDYTVPDPVRVVAYSDRIDIWSPGGLDPRVDPARFLRGDVRPVWRNQALAWVCIKLQLAQSEGQGIPTIQRSLADGGSAPATFELTPDSVACVLPAHPRHALVRTLLAIEDDVVHGRTAAALARLEPLLHEDPFNVRTIALLADTARLTQDRAPLLRFLEGHAAHLDRFPAAAQLTLADALLTAGPPSPAAGDLARALLSHATTARKSLDDTRRLVINWLLLGDEDEALAELDLALRTHAAWGVDPSLLQLRGRAMLARAKRASRVLRQPRAPVRLRASARAAVRASLDAADADLHAALAHGAVGVVRAHAEDDLRFLAWLRAQGSGRR